MMLENETETVDRSELEASAAERLAEVFSDDSDIEVEDVVDEIDDIEDPDDEDDSIEEVDEDESLTEESDDTADDSDDEAEAEDEEAVSEDVETSDDPTLPESYIRSLKAYGWTDESIQSSLDKYGVDFVNTAASIHANRNAEVTAWAESGRRTRNPAGEESKGTETKTAPKFQKIDVNKITETYGDDEALMEVVASHNSLAEYIEEIMPIVEGFQQQSQNQEVDGMLQRVDSFFGSPDMKSYTDLYGENDKWTEEQLGNRNQVLDWAFNLIEGAKVMRGKPIPLDEALTIAHDVVSRDFVETAAANKVKSTATKRSKSVSLKPTKRNSRDTSNERPVTREELESATRQRLSSAFK